jgi:hypothetical protein
MPGDGESRKTGLRTLGRLSGGNQGAQVADELPALRLRQLGPDGHSVPNYTVGKDPELDAAQLLHRPQKLDAGVDRSTLYRTLQLHIHMACLRCGKIMEFVSDIFEKLKGQAEKDCRSGSWYRD